MIMTGPLIAVVQVLPSIPASLACGARIQKFILSAARSDPRNGASPAGEESLSKSLEISLSQSPIDHSDSVSFNLENTGAAVTLVKASFGWTDATANKTTVLTGISLRLGQVGLHVVTVPVASGKSTLLNGILGEADRHDGIVHITEAEVAFCDQNVWLQNGTVRDNIVVYCKYDESLYRKAIEAVSLQQDLKSWPKGDQTVVGSRGLALSGGPKRRIVRPPSAIFFFIPNIK